MDNVRDAIFGEVGDKVHWKVEDDVVDEVDIKVITEVDLEVRWDVSDGVFDEVYCKIWDESLQERLSVS